MDAPEEIITRSIRRLGWYLSQSPRPPGPVIDHEMRLVVKQIGGLVGPDKVRRWMDEVSADLLSGVTERRTAT